MSRTHVVAFLLVLSLGFGLGQLTSAEEPPPTKSSTVKAERYQIAWADSALDVTHGAQRVVHEIYLPQSKVAFSLHFDRVWVEAPKAEYVTNMRVVAQPTEAPRNQLTGIGTPPAKIEDIEIPAALAKEMEAFAKLDARLRAEARRVGEAMRDQLDLKEIQHPRGR